MKRFISIWMIPVLSVGHGLLRLLWPVELSPSDVEMIANLKLTDPGPASLYESVFLGFLPAVVYLIIAFSLASLIMRKRVQ